MSLKINIISVLYYVIPAAALAFFIFSLIRYIKAKRKCKFSSEAYTAAQLQSRLICLIVSAVIAGIMLTAILTFGVLLSLAVAFM